MSTLIVKVGCPWVHVPATDDVRSYWINLATVRKVTWHSNPARCTLHFASKEEQTLVGIQAIAIIDAVKELAGDCDGE